MNKSRFDTETGRRISRLLVEARSTQRRLARLLGVPHSTLNQMITGRLPPWPDLEHRSRVALGLMEEVS
jgi:transcriptional regulator with XRE-family HTH domain